jgi:hypothetical protein
MSRVPFMISCAAAAMTTWSAVACDRRAPPHDVARARPPTALPAARKNPSGVPPAAAPVAGLAPAAAEQPAPVLAAGAWAETELFRFRVTELRRCRTKLVLSVQVQARHDLFVSPRDLALERAGVVHTSELEAAPGCGRPLRPRSLRSGQNASGVVVFAIPEEEARGSRVVFAPTRWGGAPRVTVAMPERAGKDR